LLLARALLPPPLTPSNDPLRVPPEEPKLEDPPDRAPPAAPVPPA
jgi:hypothetical protein